MLGKILILLFLLAFLRSFIRFCKARRISDGLFAVFWVSLAAYSYFEIFFLMLIPILSLLAASLAKAQDSGRRHPSREEKTLEKESSSLSTGDVLKVENKPTEADCDEDDSLIDQIPELAEQWVTYGKIKGCDFDYSRESLQKVDDLVSQEWSDNSPLFPQVTILQIGSYMGEVIRRKHGGEWVESEDYGICLARIGGQEDFRSFPFNKARKRIEEGEEDSVAFFYRALVHTLEKDSDEEDS